MSFIKQFSFKVILSLIAMTMPFSVVVKAAAPQPFDTESLSAFKVVFLGGDNEELQFNVKYASKERSNFKLLVLDETGEALFEDTYSKDIDKKIIVPRLTDSEHVTFIVKAEKENTEISYKVRVTTRVVDDAIALRN